MKNSLLFKSKNNNFYLYSASTHQFSIIHPLLYLMLEKYNQNQDIELLDDFLLHLEKADLFQEYSKQEVNYYTNKFKFLIKNKILGSHIEETIPLKAEKIESSFNNVKFIVFEVTEDCNLKCSYCSYGKYYNDYDIDRSKENLSTDKAISFLDHLYEVNRVKIFNYELSITFFGGEPLLRFDFIEEIVNYFQMKRPTQKVRFGITTNAMLLDNYIDFLVKNKFNLLISIDGNADHNSFRRLKNGKPSYEIIHRNIKIIQKFHPYYYNNYVNFNAVQHLKNENRGSVSEYFKTEFNKKPNLSLIKRIGVKKELESEFNNSLLPNHLSREVTVEIENKNLSTIIENYQFLYNDLYSIYIDSNKPSSLNKTFLNGTCIPFQVKIFISAKGKLMVCEKVSQNYDVGKIDERGDIILDYDEISKKYNSYSEKISYYCKICYKNNCNKCMFETNLESRNFTCNEFISKSSFINKIVQQISIIEENPVSILNNLNNFTNISEINKNKFL